MRSVTVFAFVLALPLVACGGRVALPTESDPGSGDAGTDAATPDGDVPPVDGSFDDGTDAPRPDGPLPDGSFPDGAPPGDHTCEALVKSLCGDDAKACCTKTGFPHDAEACTNAVSYWCNYKVEAAADGVVTYDDAQLAACAASYRSAMTSCTLHWLEWAKSSVPCAHLFNGKKAPGAACTSELDCNAAPGFSAYCDEGSKRCRAYGVVGAGSPCNFYGSTIRYCDFGLYCDLAAETPVCKPEKKLGAPCDGPDDFSCGYERTCKGGACAPGLPPGSPCTSDLECTTWSCQAGKCAANDTTLANEWVCTGSASGG